MTELDPATRKAALRLLESDSRTKGPDYWNSRTKWLMDKYLSASLTIPALGICFATGLQIFSLDRHFPFVSLPRYHPLYGTLYQWKLRTMPPGTDKQPQPNCAAEFRHLKMSGDPRVIPQAMIWRRTSFDEMPQIFNVIINDDLRLVGPRPLSQPEWINDIEPRSHLEPYQTFVHNLNAGLGYGTTCLASILGRHQLQFEQRLQLDNLYASHASAAADWRIFLHTLLVPLKLTGA